MEIIAKTKDGCLIQASEREVKEILSAVAGKKPEKLDIGQKIPAIDYATTITKVKTLEDSYEFKELSSEVNRFSVEFEKLKSSIQEAGKIII